MSPCGYPVQRACWPLPLPNPQFKPRCGNRGGAQEMVNVNQARAKPANAVGERPRCPRTVVPVQRVVDAGKSLGPGWRTGERVAHRGTGGVTVNQAHLTARAKAFQIWTSLAGRILQQPAPSIYLIVPKSVNSTAINQGANPKSLGPNWNAAALPGWPFY